jgi:hypothetical protein
MTVTSQASPQGAGPLSHASVSPHGHSSPIVVPASALELGFGVTWAQILVLLLPSRMSLNVLQVFIHLCSQKPLRQVVLLLQYPLNR